MRQIKNVVFDFGGVIIDIDRDRAVKKFVEIGVKDADNLLDKYHQKGIFLEIEDGRIAGWRCGQDREAACTGQDDCPRTY